MKPILKQHIGYWINRVRMHIHQAFEQRLEPYGITVAQWCILITLYDRKATSIGELSNYIEVDKASISRVVDRLMIQDLVSHLEGKDRRSGHVQLTAKGNQLLPQLIREAAKNDQFFFGDLTTEESEQLQFLLSKILKKIPSVTLEGWMKKGELMSQTDTIANILKNAKDHKWAYPKTFQLLKEAGVESYRVSWGKEYVGIYLGTFGEWRESAPKGFHPISASFGFCEESVKKAITKHQQGKTTFVQVLEELFKAGVTHYYVDMDKKAITYFDSQEDHSYQEHIP